MRDEWTDSVKREELLTRLEEIGIDFPRLAQTTGQPDAEPLDLLCRLAFQRPLRTRREPTDQLRKGQPDLFGGPSEMRQAVDRLQALLYAE